MKAIPNIHDQRKKQLSDDGLTGWRDIALRIKEHLTPKSALLDMPLDVTRVMYWLCHYSILWIEAIGYY